MYAARLSRADQKIHAHRTICQEVKASMKYLRQFCIILFVSFLGEVLHALIPFPVPASVYGLILMFLALCTGILKPEQVRETAAFLIEIMPVMFIPAAAGLLDAWPSLRPIWLPVTLITVITTVVVMAVTGQVTQYMIRREKRTNDASRSKTQTWRS